PFPLQGRQRSFLSPRVVFPEPAQRSHTVASPAEITAASQARRKAQGVTFGNTRCAGLIGVGSDCSSARVVALISMTAVSPFFVSRRVIWPRFRSTSAQVSAIASPFLQPVKRAKVI